MTNTKQQIFWLKQKKKQTINEIIRLITSAYEKFFTDLRSYNFIDFKKKAESMVLN